MSRYWSQRNTYNRTHIFGDASADNSGHPLTERGPPGPPGRNGLNGIDGIDGAPGANGTSEFLWLDAIPLTVNNASQRLKDINFKVYGSADFLTDPRAALKTLTNQGYNQNRTVDCLALLVKRGIYRVTMNTRTVGVDAQHIAFDVDKNGNMNFANSFTGEDDTAILTDANRTFTYTRYYYVPHDNTNFWWMCQSTVSYTNVGTIHPQLMIERIGHLPQSTASTGNIGHLTVPNGQGSNSNYRTIMGGIDWGNTNVVSPPSDTNLFVPVGQDHPTQVGGWTWKFSPVFFM